MSLDLNGAAAPVPTEPEWKSKGSVLKMRVPAPKRNVSAPPQPATAKAKQTPHPKEAPVKDPNPQQTWQQQQQQQQWPSEQDQQWTQQQHQQKHQPWPEKPQRHQSWRQQQKQSWQQQKQHNQQQQQQQQPPQTAQGSSKAGWAKDQPAPSMLERAVPRPPSRASGAAKGSWQNSGTSPSTTGAATEVQRVAETRGGVLRMSEVRKLADARKDTEGKGPNAAQQSKAAQTAKAAPPVDVAMVVKAAKSKASPPAGGFQQEDQLQTLCLQGQQPGPGLLSYPQPRPPFPQLPHQQQTNQLRPPFMQLHPCAGMAPCGPPQAPQQLQQMQPLSKDLYVAASPSSNNDLQSAAENAFQAQILDEQRQEEQAQQLAQMQAEQQRKAAEDAVRQRQEHVKQLACAAIEAVKAAQQRAEEAAASAKPLLNAPVEMQETMLQATERAIAIADAAITEAARSMDNTALAISAYDAAGTMEVAEEFWSLNEKLQEARITIDGARPTVDSVHNQLQARKEALERDLRIVFTRYDVDADGYLSRAEVLAFAKGEHGYDLNQEQLERLIASLVGDWLAGVPFENFHQLNSMIATEKGAAQARELDARKAAIHEEMTFATTILKGVEALAGKVKAAAEGLRRHPVSQRKAAAGNVKSGLASGRAKLESSEALTSNLTASSSGSADDPLDAIVRGFREQAVAEFVARVNAVRASLDAAEQSLAAEEIQLQHVGFVEMEELRVKIAYAIRGFMLVRSKTKDQLFEQASTGNATVSLEAFSQFLTTLVAQCPKKSLPEEVCNLTASTEKVAAAFDHLTRSGSAPMDRPRFIRCLVNMRYCAVNGQATLATDTSRMSMRRYLLPGETFEAMDLTEVASPSSPSVRQARVKALSDGAEGWILVAPDAARPSHAALQCVSETILTKAMVAAEGALLRRIQEGELVEALPMDAELSDTAGLVRFRCRTLADSLEGWATLRGNNNRLFFELP